MKVRIPTFVSPFSHIISGSSGAAGAVGAAKTSLGDEQAASLASSRTTASRGHVLPIQPYAKGSLLGHYIEHYRQLDDLIGRIQCAQECSPTEIDQGLRPDDQ